MEQGLMHIYHGDGKGKTTCACGLALRCIGCGYRVRMVQFLKSADTGEIEAFKHLENIELLRGEQPACFTYQMTAEQKAQTKERCEALLERAFAHTENLRMLILDEVLIAIKTGMLEEGRLLELLRERPQQLEVVLTGRNPSESLLELADYVTELRKIKHPYDRGIIARRGIEK